MKGPTNTAGDASDAAALRRRGYLVFLGATSVLGWLSGFVVPWGEAGGAWMVPTLLSVLSTLFFVLLLSPRSLRFVELTVFAAGAAYFLGKFGLALFSNAGDEQFVSFISWFYVLYVWIFLVLGPRYGILVSGGLWAVCVGAIVTVASGGAFAERPNDVVALGEFFTSSLPVLAGLYAFARLLAGSVAARARSEALAEAALRDPLTGLPNRLLFDDRLASALARAERSGTRFAVAFVDLDHFKAVNDGYGHQAGDTLLRGIAQRLHGCVRASDTVARISGDEFALILEGVDDRAALDTVGAKLLAEFDAPFDLGTATHTATASIGLAAYPDHGTDPDALMHAADRAMYVAKGDGRHGYRVFGDAPDDAPTAGDGLEAELERALEQREFVLHYQPLYGEGGARVTAVEALLRWNHPERGLLAPDAFIETAERSEIIHDLGAWVLREACLQVRTWQHAGIDAPRMSVNVAALQLEDPGFPARVARVLAETGLEPDLLDLEVTERSVVSLAATTRLRELRALGVGISLDDFGNGRSSLARLQSLPVSGFKIDRSFVRNLDARYVPLEDGRLMLETIVTLARALGLRVVAEGVETEEQRATLTRLACDELQGYLLARPMPADELTTRLRPRRSGSGRDPATADVPDLVASAPAVAAGRLDP